MTQQYKRLSVDGSVSSMSADPDSEFESMAYQFDDLVDLAQEGVYGDLAMVRAEMLDYLSKV